MGGGGRGSANAANQQRLSELLTAAIDAAERGRGRVFLLAPGQKVPRAGDTGYQRRATRNTAEIAAALACHPDCNVGVIPAPGLFVLDDDGGLAAWPHAHALPATVTTITGGGGRHRWFALPPARRGWRVKGARGVLPDVDIVGSEGSPQYVVNVGSIHPNTGAVYQWAPGLSPAQVPIATAPPELVTVLEGAGLLLPPHVAAVSTAAADANTENTDPAALVEAALLARPKSRRAGAEIRFACCFHDDEKPSASWSTAKARFFCHGCGAKGGARKLAKGLGLTLPTDTTDRTRGEASRLATLALAWPWQRAGEGGAAARAILLFLIDLARKTGQMQVDASMRRIAEAVGLDKSTVIRCLQAERPTTTKRAGRPAGILLRIGWVRTISTNEHGTNVYLLTRPPSAHSATNSFSERKRQTLLVAKCAPSSDAFRRGSGLGKTAALVLAALDTGATFATAAELARLVGSVPATARRTLAALAKHNLAKKGADGWHRGGGELALVAATLPTAGALERQRKVHAADREQYAKAKAERAEKGRLWLVGMSKAAAQYRGRRRRRRVSRPVVMTYQERSTTRMRM